MLSPRTARRCGVGRAGTRRRQAGAAPDRRRTRRSRRVRQSGDRARDIPPWRHRRAADPPPSTSRRLRKRERTAIGLDDDVPALRTGLAEVELGCDRQPPRICSARLAAIGASRLAGNASSADVTNSGCGRMRVRIESALMPGSNTPSPPGSKIQACPGCQTRTSSFQLMRTELILRCRQQLPRRLDRGRIARMPGREQRPRGPRGSRSAA